MDVMEAIKMRRSVRKYAEKDISPQSYQKLKDSLRFAPSACNFQPWKFVMVKDASMKAKLAEASKEQMWMQNASVIVVACGEPEKAYKEQGGYWNSVDVDLSIALDHLSLAAVSEGLGTCWIGAFSEQKIKDLLEIPTDMKVVGLMPVGHPLEEGLNHSIFEDKRKPEKEVFCNEKFSVTF